MTRAASCPEAPARSLNRFVVQALGFTSLLAAFSIFGSAVEAQPLPYEFWAAKAELEKRLSTIAEDEQRLALLLEIVANPKAETELRRQAAERLPSLMPISRKGELFELGRSMPRGEVAGTLFHAAWTVEIASQSPQDALETLESMVVGTYKGNEADLVDRRWAAEELCERGALSRFKAVLNLYRSLSSDTSRVLRKVQFCHQRMTVLAESASPEQAYIKALADTSPERRLARWAVERLGENRSETAEAALLAHALRIDKSPHDLDSLVYDEIYRTFRRWGWNYEALSKAGLTGLKGIH